MLIVYFQHAEDDLELRLCAPALLDILEELLAGHRNDTLVGAIANHGVRLATASLPVGKQGTVIPVPGIGQNATT